MSISISSGKVLNSLYKNQRGGSSFYTGAYTKTSTVENTSVTGSLSINSDFHSAVRKLKNHDYGSGLYTDVKKAVKQIVKNYNEFVESKGDGSKAYGKAVSDMKKLFGEYKEDLSKIGVDFDGDKLKFDIEKFALSKVTDLEEILSPEGKFLNESDKILKSARRTILNQQYSTLKEDAYVSNNVDGGNLAYAAGVNNLAVAAQRLTGTDFSDPTQEAVVKMLNDYKDGIEEFSRELEKENGFDTLNTSDKAKRDVQEIKRLNQEYLDAVSNSTEESPMDYGQWFAEDEDSYGNKVMNAYKDLFAELVNAGKKDFEISSFVDYSV